MAKTYCPECDGVITIADPQYGALFKCPDCEVELEVISTNPFEVYCDEDWDQDWDDDADGDDTDGDDEEEPDYDQ